MAERDSNTQVNVDFTNFPELFEALEEMVSEDMTNKSIFIRKLVKEEYERRNPPTKKTQRVRATAAPTPLAA